MYINFTFKSKWIFVIIFTAYYRLLGDSSYKHEETAFLVSHCCRFNPAEDVNFKFKIVIVKFKVVIVKSEKTYMQTFFNVKVGEIP